MGRLRSLSGSVLVTAIIFFLVPVSAKAFKVDTHIWVGQQVINDLEDDGQLTFKLNNKPVEISVSGDVVDAILSNKSDYLAGNIGPDAFPDAVAGQMVVHPGESSWRTDGWLNYILSRSSDSATGKAFAYGYLGHAAADVFSHSYVNQYAGGTFILTDGETLVEQRHFMLESFISQHTPPLIDIAGQDLGSPWNQVVIDDNLAVFIRDSLIFSDSVKSQYFQNPSTSHLPAYFEYRKAVDDLAESPLWHELDILAAQIVANYFDISLSHNEADQIVNAAQPIIDALNGDIPDTLQKLDDKFFYFSMKYEGMGFEALDNANNDLARLESDLLTLKKEYEDVLYDLTIQSLNVCPYIPDPNPLHCFKCKWYGCWYWDCTPLIEDPICVFQNSIAQNIIDNLYQEKASLENQIFGVNGIKEQYLDALVKARDNAIIAANASLNIKNAIIDLAQIPYADASPIQSVLRYWRDDVDRAMMEYVKATGQSIINTMNPDADAIEPIANWFDCYHLSIIGMPNVVSGCEFRNSISDLKMALTATLTIIEQYSLLHNVLGTPGYMELKNLENQLIDQMVAELKLQAGEQLEDMLPAEVQEIIALLDAVPDAATLNMYFTKPETTSQKGLVMIPDVAERIEAEMYLNGGYFNPQKYAVAYDAVVLAKLALLNKNQLNELASQAGVPPDQNGKELFDDVDNAVSTAFTSIDADHQWMETPPPVPNTLGQPFVTAQPYVSEIGFLPWKDKAKARNLLFRSLFIGPLSPGIDAPRVISKVPILSEKYNYKPCFSYPFPNSINDNTCDAIMLIPILNGLLGQ